MIIAVDFDGTLQNDSGVPNMQLINTLRQQQRNGDVIILWTCRVGKSLNDAINFCAGYGLRFNYVNQNCSEAMAYCKGNESRKIFADVYIDDKSIPVEC